MVSVCCLIITFAGLLIAISLVCDRAYFICRLFDVLVKSICDWPSRFISVLFVVLMIIDVWLVFPIVLLNARILICDLKICVVCLEMLLLVMWVCSLGVECIVPTEIRFWI